MRHGYTKGRAHPRLYRIWSCMKTRVKNPNRPQYSDYGGEVKLLVAIIGGMQMNATMLNERKERHSNGLENW